MHQILHIFRKDVRHHWPDILLALGILAAYAWNQPGEWHPRDPRSQISHEMILRYLPFMVMLAWSFLIARAVLTEPLVGDRQFWVTKPYEWQKLLIAKLLLVAVFVSIPLFAAQLFLLSEAGFSPAPHITDLLLIQIWWIILLLLPLATLATLTSNLAQLVLTILGIFVLLIGIAILNTRIRYAGSIPAHWLPGWIEPAILLGTAAAVVVLQYARRKTLRSRLFLIGAVAAALLISTVRKQPAFSLQRYPRSSAGEQLPLQVGFDPSVADRGSAALMENNKVPVRIPLLLSGIPQNGAASVDGAMVEIEAADTRWNSGWFRIPMHFLPTQDKSQLSFAVDKPFFERVKNTPSTLHISFALTGFHAQEVRRVVAANGDFEVPGEVICSMWWQDSRSLRCRTPLGRPFLALTVLPEESTCPRDESQKDQSDNAALSAVQWGWYRASAPALSPVDTFFLSLWRPSWNRLDNGPPNVLCPGTPLNFEILREHRRARGTLTIEGIRLVDYQPKVWSPAGGVGVGFAVTR
jgi:hypothetical protein